ncbi:glycosyltransferase [Deferribacterales bacterium RsTz2092]|nr:glycosyl transferase [Deferribacterales bacterium]
MANNPAISIIIPTYNVELYLRKCLDSLLVQTFTGIEVLCVNDGSTDNSLAILQEYASKDERIRVFTHENQGVGYTRNVGLKNARGEYIMWCDPDDWYEPTMCEEMFSAIEREGVDLVTCDVNMLNSTGSSDFYGEKSSYLRLKLQGLHVLDETTRKNINASLVNKIFKRELLERYSILAPVGSVGAEDTAMVWQYLMVASSYYGLDRVLYNCLVRTDSITGNASDDMLEKYFYNTLLAYKTAVQFSQKYNLLNRDSFILASLKDYAYQQGAHSRYMDFFKLIKADILDVMDTGLLDENGILFAIKSCQFEQAKQLADLWAQFIRDRRILSERIKNKVKATHGK